MRPRRRVFQFSSRTLLLIVLSLSLAFGWVGILSERTRRQKKILSHFDRYNPSATFDRGYVVSLFFRGKPLANRGVGPDDEDLIHLKGFTRLKYLDLASSNVTDAGLSNLSEMKTLRTLARIIHAPRSYLPIVATFARTWIY